MYSFAGRFIGPNSREFYIFSKEVITQVGRDADKCGYINRLFRCPRLLWITFLVLFKPRGLKKTNVVNHDPTALGKLQKDEQFDRRILVRVSSVLWTHFDWSISAKWSP